MVGGGLRHQGGTTRLLIRAEAHDRRHGWRWRAMTTFMDVHHGMEGITAEQLSAAHRADLEIEAEEGVHFERAWADPDAGVVYCLSEAPSAEAVKRIHERTGHPASEIHPVPLSV
jgi:uncharacterized protein DUF4242